jgi:hypothetical protein
VKPFLLQGWPGVVVAKSGVNYLFAPSWVIGIEGEGSAASRAASLMLFSASPELRMPKQNGLPA